MRFRFLFFILLSMIIHLNGFGQESYFALRGGYNVSTLNSSNDSSPTIKPRKTFSLGAVYCNEPNTTYGKLGYTIEIGYIQKGTKIDSDTLDYKFHYINAPLLVDFYPIPKLKISAGVELSFLTKAQNRNFVDIDSVVYENDVPTDTITTRTDMSYSLLGTYDKRFEVSGVVDASYSLTFFMNIGMRYSHSFTNVSKYDRILDRQNLNNKYFQLYILLKIAN